MDPQAPKDAARLRPLLPAVAGQRPDPTSPRRNNRVNACEACRARKGRVSATPLQTRVGTK
jgi:hypothetical protein